jgi:transcriptional regulator GlxA family with amidase domain
MKRTLLIAALLAASSTNAALGGGPGYCYDPGDRAGYVCPPCQCEGDRHAEKNDGRCRTCNMELVALKDLTHVAILVYDGVELLDFTGPAEVFTSAGSRFYVYTVSASGRAVRAQGFMKFEPDYSMENCPWPDVLVIPGGRAGEVANNKLLLQWIRTVSESADCVLSVCSGAFVLAKAGLLDGLEATAHAADVEALRKVAPRTRVHAKTRFVDNGKIVTAAGVSSGIDGALRVVQKLHGDEAAAKAARRLEYPRWSPGDGVVVSVKGGRYSSSGASRP